MLFESIKNNNLNIKHIYLGRNFLDDNCMSICGEMLTSKKSIVSLGLEKNMITNDGVEILFNYILKGTSLISLDLSENKDINDKIFPKLFEVIEKTSVDQISGKGTSITFQNILPLLKKIAKQEASINIAKK